MADRDCCKNCKYYKSCGSPDRPMPCMGYERAKVTSATGGDVIDKVSEKGETVI